MITFPAPMLAAKELRLPLTSDDWIYEIKFHGYRCIAGIEEASDAPIASQRNNAQRVRLATKSGHECTRWFPEIVRDLDLLPGGPHVIDGEACVLREDGTSDFSLLQQRARRRKWYRGAPLVTLCCFDLLMCNGKPTMHLPLTRRKDLLRALIDLIDDPKPGLMFVGHLPADTRLFGSTAGAGLDVEGVVAKRKDSVYTPGTRSDDWLKFKRPG